LKSKERPKEKEKQKICSSIRRNEPLDLLFCLPIAATFVVMANSPALNGSIAVTKKGDEKDEEKINKKRSHGNDEAQAQASEKHFAPPADQASVQACTISSPPSEEGKSEQYPSGIRLFIIIVALILSVFLVCVHYPYAFPSPKWRRKADLCRAHLGSTGHGESPPWILPTENC
jgi:hypothetical protein